VDWNACRRKFHLFLLVVPQGLRLPEADGHKRVFSFHFPLPFFRCGDSSSCFLKGTNPKISGLLCLCPSRPPTETPHLSFSSLFSRSSRIKSPPCQGKTGIRGFLYKHLITPMLLPRSPRTSFLKWPKRRSYFCPFLFFDILFVCCLLLYSLTFEKCESISDMRRVCCSFIFPSQICPKFPQSPPSFPPTTGLC